MDHVTQNSYQVNQAEQVIKMLHVQEQKNIWLTYNRGNKGKIKGTVSYEFKFMVTDRLEITILT